MRIAMNSLMVSKWQVLGHYQGRYVPGMIGPFLKVSLIPHNGEWLGLFIIIIPYSGKFSFVIRL